MTKLYHHSSQLNTSDLPHALSQSEISNEDGDSWITYEYLAMLGCPDLAVYVSDREVKADDLVTDKQLHSSVIFQQRHQLTVYSNQHIPVSSSSSATSSQFTAINTFQCHL